MANIAAIRTTSAFTAIASEQFIPKFVSDRYQFSPILSAMTAQPGSDRQLRPKGDKETPLRRRHQSRLDRGAAR